MLTGGLDLSGATGWFHEHDARIAVRVPDRMDNVDGGHVLRVRPFARWSRCDLDVPRCGPGEDLL